MVVHKGWSQAYTCPSCTYEMTLWFDGKRFRIKGWEPQSHKPNVRRVSTTRGNALSCPSCGYPLPPSYNS